MKITRFLAAFLLLLVLAVLAAAPSAQAVQQAGLDVGEGGDVLEVNHDDQGNLYVSDGTLNKIWQITPSSGYYQTYSFSHKVRDAQPDNNGRIWWVSDSDVFGYVTPGTPFDHSWTLNLDLYPFLHTLIPDGQGGIWMGESGFYDENGRLFHFNPNDRRLCQYDLPGGAPTNDMLYQSGYLWLADSRAGRLFRISQEGDGIRYIFWQANGAGLAWGIDYDGRYLWWADYNLKAIGRLEPDLNQATYYYLPDVTLPLLPSPIMVKLDKGIVWFTALGNWVGMLNPALAQGDSMELYRDEWDTNFVPENCTTLGIYDDPSISLNSGYLGWEDSPVSQVFTDRGWKLYELPDALTFGLTAADNSIWASDNGRDLLLRFDSETPNSVFIPIIIRP